MKSSDKEAIKEQALKFLKDKYQNKNNKLYFDETDLPLKTSIDKITKYMAEFASQQKEAEAVGWISFDERKPEPMQPILITWPSGEYTPETRTLSKESLKSDWSGMRWMPIPEWKPIKQHG